MTFLLAALGAVVGFFLGLMTNPFVQAVGIGTVLPELWDVSNPMVQGILTNGVVGAVIGVVLGIVVAKLLQRKQTVAPPQ